jgi:prepilin-type N-terminal cleavage/methylation domain-containing protein
MNTRRKGFTLIEIAVTLAILGVVFGSIVQVNRATMNTYNQTSAVALVQTQVRRVLDRITVELENGGLGTLQPDPVINSSDNVIFQVSTGVDSNTGAIVFGSPSRLSLIPEPGETMNGVDDNGNGLVDECQLVLTRNYLQANQQTVVLAHRVSRFLEKEINNGADDNGNGLVDEHGFCVFREGNLLRVRLTMERAVRQGKVARATVETSVRLRN